jgi:hypothetical protein
VADELGGRDCHHDQLLRNPVGDHTGEQGGKEYADRARGGDYGQTRATVQIPYAKAPQVSASAIRR